MARQPRYVLPGYVQHVIQRGNNHAAIFLRDEDYDFYLQCLGEACSAHACAVHAYVLMPNHVHLLLMPDNEHGVSKVMQSIGGRYAQYINSAYRRTGTVWGGRYRSTVIEPDDYLLPCMYYIELNPVRVGMVAHAQEYRWSSYAGNADGDANALLTPHPVYGRLGETQVERQVNYRARFGAALDARMLDDIRNSTNKGWALGGNAFRDGIETVLNRRTRPLPRGGDRRSAQARQRSLSIESDPTGFAEHAMQTTVEPKPNKPHR